MTNTQTNQDTVGTAEKVAKDNIVTDDVSKDSDLQDAVSKDNKEEVKEDAQVSSKVA